MFNVAIIGCSHISKKHVESICKNHFLFYKNVENVLLKNFKMAVLPEEALSGLKVIDAIGQAPMMIQN